jgi:dTDP-4-dehydrorhamnose reductase
MTQQDRVLIFGWRGYLGRLFLSACPGALTTDADIADPCAVDHALRKTDPDVVINCAGRPGRPNVDWCEEHREETLCANVTGPLVLAGECLRRGVYLVQLGSGCLYQGDKGGEGFSEDDPPNFTGSFYARTKAWAEQALREFPVLILRPRMPFDGSGSPRCLLSKLSGYRRVLTTRNSLTHLPDFLQVAKALIAQRATGVYNVVNEGALSPFEIMQLYRQLVEPTHVCEPLAPEQLGQVAHAGRSSCLLNTEKLARAGIRLPPVREAAEAALRRLKQVLASRGEPPPKQSGLKGGASR